MYGASHAFCFEGEHLMHLGDDNAQRHQKLQIPLMDHIVLPIHQMRHHFVGSYVLPVLVNHMELRAQLLLEV